MGGRGVVFSAEIFSYELLVTSSGRSQTEMFIVGSLAWKLVPFISQRTVFDVPVQCIER